MGGVEDMLLHFVLFFSSSLVTTDKYYLVSPPFLSFHPPPPPSPFSQSTSFQAKNREPTLLVLKDMQGGVFGGFATRVWMEKGESYYGDGESFVWSLVGEAGTEGEAPLRKYAWSTENSYFQLSTSKDGLAMGGGGSFALFVDPELLNGSSGACETFFSSPSISPLRLLPLLPHPARLRWPRLRFLFRHLRKQWPSTHNSRFWTWSCGRWRRTTWKRPVQPWPGGGEGVTGRKAWRPRWSRR